MERIRRFSDNERNLEGFSKRGDHLARAYAGTLLLCLTERAPYLAPAKLPHGTVHYALRGKAKKEKLIGVQHYDDAVLRLLAVADIAAKKRLHIYSLKSGMVCTGRVDKPPKEFVEEALGRLEYKLHQSTDTLSCPHAQEKDVLEIVWNAAEVKFVICKGCLSPDHNVISTISRFMLVPELKSSFSAGLRFNVACSAQDRCPFASKFVVEAQLFSDYCSGELSDVGLFEKAEAHAYENTRKAHKVFVLGNRCFEDNGTAFLNALGPSAEERKALEGIIPRVEEALIVKEGSVAKVLSALWDEHGKEAIRSLVEDDGLAEDLFNKSKRLRMEPVEILKEAANIVQTRRITASLPTFERLPPVASFADRIARAYKLRGEREIAREIEGERPQDTKRKSVGLAFLIALGQSKGKEWQYRKEEIELASFLAGYTKELLAAEGEKYRHVLQELLIASGSAERI